MDEFVNSGGRVSVVSLLAWRLTMRFAIVAIPPEVSGAVESVTTRVVIIDATWSYRNV